MNATLSALLGIIKLFFGGNPTVEEAATVIEQVGPAIASAKAGQAFSVDFPISIDAKPGTATFEWVPTATASENPTSA